MADNNIKIAISAQDLATATFDKLNRKFTEFNTTVDKTSRRFTEMNAAVTSLAGAISLAGVVALTRDMTQAGLQLEKLNKLFSAAAGSADLGGREFEYVRQLSERMGLSFVDTAESYGKFVAAMRGSAMEGEQGRRVFESVSGATTALGLSAAETSGVFNALQQMISKGKVQAEELRGQLGERLPGAFKLAADAMGITTAELDKQLALGNVMAADLLPRLAEQLDKTYGQAATAGARSAAAELNRLNNAMFEAKAAAGSALVPALTDIARALVPVIEGTKAFVGGLQIMSIKAAHAWDNMTGNKTMDEKRRSMQVREEAIAELMKRYSATTTDYSAAEKAMQAQRASVTATSQAASATSKASAAATDKLKRQREEAEKLKLKLEEIRNLETGALEAGGSFGASSLGGGSFLQTGSSSPGYSLMNDTSGMMIDSSRFSLTGSGAGQDPSRWNMGNEEIQMLEEQKQQMLDIEQRYNQQMMASKMEFAEQSLGLLAASSKEGSAIQIAALVAMKALAVAQIIMNAHAAASAALLPPPIGLGPIAGQAMSAQIIAKGYANAAITGAVGIMQLANSVSGKREFGGPVVAGQSYLVGEKRPEIFTPNQSGWITPRADMGGGGIVQQISIDARGADSGVLARIDASMKRAKEEAKAEIMSSLNRGGAYSRAVGRA